MFKALCSVRGKMFGFCFSETPYHSIRQNFETMFPRSNLLENAFMSEYLLVFRRPPKITQPRFVLSATSSFLFSMRISVYM